MQKSTQADFVHNSREISQGSALPLELTFTPKQSSKGDPAFVYAGVENKWGRRKTWGAVKVVF